MIREPNQGTLRCAAADLSACKCSFLHMTSGKDYLEPVEHLLHSQVALQNPSVPQAPLQLLELHRLFTNKTSGQSLFVKIVYTFVYKTHIFHMHKQCPSRLTRQHEAPVVMSTSVRVNAV